MNVYSKIKEIQNILLWPLLYMGYIIRVLSSGAFKKFLDRDNTHLTAPQLYCINSYNFQALLITTNCYLTGVRVAVVKL